MRVLWVCNIMLPVIAQALSQEYSVREGWLSGILGRYLETENGAGRSYRSVCSLAAIKKKSPAMALQRIWSTRSAMTARWKRVFCRF